MLSTVMWDTALGGGLDLEGWWQTGQVGHGVQARVSAKCQGRKGQRGRFTGLPLPAGHSWGTGQPPGE